MDLQSVLSEIGAWPIGDRLRLVGEIWDGLVDQGYQSPLPQELTAEIERRIHHLDQDPDSAVAWETVEGKALERFRR